MSWLSYSSERSIKAWRYVGAGFLGYAVLTGAQAINNIPIKHGFEAALQQAYRHGDRYLQGEDQQQVNDEGALIDWEATTAGMTAIGGAVTILVLGRRPRDVILAADLQTKE